MLAWGIAYCLAYEQGLIPSEMARLKKLIEAKHIPQGQGEDILALIAEAVLIAVTKEEQQIRYPTKESLQSCRLMQISEKLHFPRVALIMGGATKIKQYVFESAKLPEIRGASGLLDRINLYDIPALFAWEPEWFQRLKTKPDLNKKEITEAQQLIKHVREWFFACHEVEPPDCPECIIYANGGEVLAFAPLKLASMLVEAIEGLYTKETLIANSVAVWRSCSLMELKFGLRPLEFWSDDFAAVQSESVKKMLHEYYDESFFSSSRKTFGEIAVQLSLDKLRRREGNRVDQRPLKAVPHLETVSYARRCHSCESRNAVVERRFEGEAVGDWLCEPCARKRVFGQCAKKEGFPRIKWFKDVKFMWEPRFAKTWTSVFKEWVSEHPELKQHCDVNTEFVAPDSIDEIADASDPQGFVGVIYADGNNMGDYLARLQTPDAYREYADIIYHSIIEATFTALAKYLLPRNLKEQGKQWLHPFEVLSIGGDDIFLIVPAHVALPIAVTLAKQFEELLKKHPLTSKEEGYQWEQVHRIARHNNEEIAVQAAVGLSSGVVIAGSHTPIFLLRQMVEELLKLAKAKAKRLHRERFYGATIDFQVLKSTGMIATQIGDFRKKTLKRNNLHLTAKPYTVEELCALLKAVNVLKEADFPRSQLHRFREQLAKGWLASTVEYLYFQSRSRNAKELRKVLDEVWKGNRQFGRLRRIGLWMGRESDDPRNKYEFENILGDLMEIYDFVPERG